MEEYPLVAIAGMIIETTNLVESVRLYSFVGAVPVRFGARSVLMKWFDGEIELRERNFLLPRVDSRMGAGPVRDCGT